MSPVTLPRQSGVTLVELIVTFAVGIIVMMVAVPSYTSIVRNSSFSSELNAFSAQIQLARAEALKRNTTVTLCPSADDGSNCNSSDDPWSYSASDLRVIYVDANGDGDIDDGETVLKEQNGFRRLELKAVAPGAGPKTIDFDRRGLLDSKYAHFEFSDEQNSARCLMISISGQISISDGNCS